MRYVRSMFHLEIKNINKHSIQIIEFTNVHFKKSVNFDCMGYHKLCCCMLLNMSVFRLNLHSMYEMRCKMKYVDVCRCSNFHRNIFNKCWSCLKGIKGIFGNFVQCIYCTPQLLLLFPIDIFIKLYKNNINTRTSFTIY